MGDKSAIQWTDATWNPTVGCDRISPGCAHCYAKDLHDRRHKAFLAGKAMAPQYAQPFEVLQLLESRLDVPLRTRKPTMFFVNSVSDLFHKDVPDAFIDKVFAVMALPTDEGRRVGTYKGYTHTFQVLTKRAQRMRDYVNAPDRKDAVARAASALVKERGGWWGTPYSWPLPNVWLGVSVENQHFADERIPLLLQTPAAVRFISAEPLLGPVDLRPKAPDAYAILGKFYGTGTFDPTGMSPAADRVLNCFPRLDWVIVGGESGKDARPFDVAWARSIVQQCQAAGVACFVKQLGADPRDRNDAGFEGDTPRSWPMDTETVDECARSFQGDELRVRLRDRKGGDVSEWPENLRVRDFPMAGYSGAADGGRAR
jgi:protein gp37